MAKDRPGHFAHDIF